MSHLDEGTLHALLDGELAANEVREIQAHLGGCSACGTRLQSVKDVLAESDRLVGALQFPGTPKRPAGLETDPAGATPLLVAPEPAIDTEAGEPVSEPGGEPSEVRPRRPQRPLDLDPVYHEAPPVLLVPDDSTWTDRRRRVILGMRWAALVLVAVGAGYLASEVRRTGAVPAVAPAPRAEAPADEPPSAVLSQEEAAGADAPPPDAAPSPATPPPAERQPVARAAATERRQSAAPPPVADPGRQEAAPPARTESRRDTPVANTEDEESPVIAADVREEAAEALAELDRQRRRERAAAATAALQRRAPATEEAVAAGAAAAEPSPPPPPAPRTLEQRSGIYLRIGLDEAARQLGRPVHVLEGMQQQFMGLAQGTASPGADPTRPVVRVVYQDPQGRMILLDQQRIRPGQAWGSGDTRWVIGEIGVALAGEPGPEILRNLRPRVR